MEENITKKFEKIFREESDAVFRFCLFRVSNKEQALDITQEVFLRLWQSFKENKEILNFKAFIFTVARHLIIDWYRKKKSISLEGIMDNEKENFEYKYDLIDEKTRDSINIEAEGRYLLDKINKLTPTSQNPIYLRFVEDLSPKEIGNILGISENAASVRINRGLLELRKEMRYDND
ncbi:MAG: sigma-70 family RNA polymerase sigma factor [Candidatus Paceibacterota bacterium]|jgi:RNA polymerase sigma-70 factor (ECF subfamily)